MELFSSQWSGDFGRKWQEPFPAAKPLCRVANPCRHGAREPYRANGNLASIRFERHDWKTRSPQFAQYAKLHSPEVWELGDTGRSNDTDLAPPVILLCSLDRKQAVPCNKT